MEGSPASWQGASAHGFDEPRSTGKVHGQYAHLSAGATPSPSLEKVQEVDPCAATAMERSAGRRNAKAILVVRCMKPPAGENLAGSLDGTVQDFPQAHEDRQGLRRPGADRGPAAVAQPGFRASSASSCGAGGRGGRPGGAGWGRGDGWRMGWAPSGLCGPSGPCGRSAR